jgi:hypothetical protein
MKRYLISLLIVLLWGSMMTVTAFAKPALDGGGPEASATSTPKPTIATTPTLTSTTDLHPAGINQALPVTPPADTINQQQVLIVTPTSGSRGNSLLSTPLLLIIGIVFVGLVGFLIFRSRK